MTLNTAHMDGGVLLFNREFVLLYTSRVCMKWSGQTSSDFKGTKKGSIYLTTHRMVFLNRKPKDPMQSFSFPFVALSNISVEQPVFGANYVKGTVVAQPNGNWTGEASFKIIFNHGGAIQFGQALNTAVQMTQRRGADIPPHITPTRGFFVINYYYSHGCVFYQWMPPRELFPERPPGEGVIITEEPPPYAGIEPLPENRRLR